ncbi:MAG: septal ring lytic transglycosylase RlpA family protein [Pseudomonadota bacterium]
MRIPPLPFRPQALPVVRRAIIAGAALLVMGCSAPFPDHTSITGLAPSSDAIIEPAIAGTPVPIEVPPVEPVTLRPNAAPPQTPAFRPRRTRYRRAGVTSGYQRVGTASWYGPGYEGRLTANGEIFDGRKLTSSHQTLPLPSYLEVVNLDNGRRIVVRVNDRGPTIPGRIIDLSERAAIELGFRRKGLTQVRIRYLGPAPLYEEGERFMRERPRDPGFEERWPRRRLPRRLPQRDRDGLDDLFRRSGYLPPRDDRGRGRRPSLAPLDAREPLGMLAPRGIGPSDEGGSLDFSAPELTPRRFVPRVRQRDEEFVPPLRLRPAPGARSASLAAWS